MSLIESYAFDRQIVISTHSPLVVDCCDAARLRLVSRHGSKTVVRKLDAAQQVRVREYLNDEGSLGEWLYTGE